MGFSELLEHFPQIQQVLFEHVTNHDHAVQVHKTGLVSDASKEVSINFLDVTGALQRPKSMTELP